MIQDILPHHFINAYHPAPPQAEDIVFCYTEKGICFKDSSSPYLVSDLEGHQDLTYLFRIDERNYFLLEDASLLKEPAVLPLRAFRRFQPDYLAFAAVTGSHLAQWMRENRYCGRCGSSMKQDEKERAMRCPACNMIVYPRISPAVIVAVLNDENRLLVTKYADRPHQKYALVAGYNEIGETIEETVLREVKEETGLDVTDLKYYKSQPWSFSGSLLFGFWCRVRGSDHITLDETELRLARWADRDEELDADGTVSLTSEMIRRFQDGKEDI